MDTGQILTLQVVLAIFAFAVYTNCKMAGRLGHDRLQGLLLSIPLVNIAVWIAWAFTESPHEQTIRQQRKHKKLLKAAAASADRTVVPFYTQLDDDDDSDRPLMPEEVDDLADALAQVGRDDPSSSGGDRLATT